jgi:hypothetical protein
VVFPKACRRVGLSVGKVILSSVWPAVWPAIIMGGFVVLTRGGIQGSWTLLMVQSMVAAAIYAGLFLLFAISRDERNWYFNKVKEIFRRGSVKNAPSELSMPL